MRAIREIIRSFKRRGKVAQATLEYLTIITVVVLAMVSGLRPGGPLNTAFSRYLNGIGDAAARITTPARQRELHEQGCWNDYSDCLQGPVLEALNCFDDEYFGQCIEETGNALHCCGEARTYCLSFGDAGETYEGCLAGFE